jgi:hypothetical protein
LSTYEVVPVLHFNLECHMKLNSSVTISSLSRRELKNVAFSISNTSHEMLVKGI